MYKFEQIVCLTAPPLYFMFEKICVVKYTVVHWPPRKCVMSLIRVRCNMTREPFAPVILLPLKEEVIVTTFPKSGHYYYLLTEIVIRGALSAQLIASL